jgi:predicted AAA+ superfamily ATPase
VGKTTLAQTAYPSLRYVNLDAVENREVLRRVPTPQWGDQVGAAILDEAHKEPALFDALKYAYDARQVDFSVILGSAQILMLERVRETLAGRVFVYELWPLALSELAAGGGEPDEPLLVKLIDHRGPIEEVLDSAPGSLLAEQDAPTVAAWSHLGRWGGMPELIRLENDDRRTWLRSYHDTYLQRDLADLVRLRDLQPFVRFQRLAALRTTGLLSYADLARDANASPATARNYLEYLRISYQAFLLQPYHENLTSSVVKAPKLYWSDLGIVRQLSGSWGPTTGSLFETQVVAEVVKLIRTLGLQVEPFFYRTRSGLEVDLLLATPGGLICAEVKSREAASDNDLRGMRAVARAAGRRFLGGLVVLKGGRIEPLDDSRRFWSVPAHRLLS